MLFWLRVVGLLLVMQASANADSTTLMVEGNRVILCSEIPIKIQIANPFTYVGKHEIRIDDLAAGERVIFVQAKNKTIEKMFILQSERFLRDSSEIYRYSFANAMEFGGHKFKPNTFAYSTVEQGKPDEGTMTHDFLKSKGFILKDELMSSRFVTVSEDRKQELILFYMENVDSSGHRISEFYNGENPTPLWEEISKDLQKRSIQSFVISVPGEGPPCTQP